MQGKFKYSTGQLLNFAQDSYLERTSRPIYAIVFLLPFIVFYEVGTIFINTNVLRHYWRGQVVASVWLQKFLEHLGFGNKLAWVVTPVVVVVILIALQLASRKRWRLRFSDFWPMIVECILLAVPLIVLSLFLSSSTQPQGDIVQHRYSAAQIQSEAMPSCSSVAVVGLSSAATDTTGSTVRGKSLLADIVTSIGAGIYEELIFRLILICILMLLFQNVLQLSRKNSIILSVLVSAALFSAYHHIDFFSGQLYQREPFNLAKFGFRTIAGIYFAILFTIRGFGITAGTHAFYDIIAVSMNTVLHQQ